MTRRRLPIGIQDFRRFRETGSYYVDETALIRSVRQPIVVART